jgi:ParB/RepB/Spo0J family partition protein
VATKRPPAEPRLDSSFAQTRPAPLTRPAATAQTSRPLFGAFEVGTDQLVPDPDQPRKRMDAERLAELGASLQEDGFIQALLVSLDGFWPDGRERYQIIAGERRWRAATAVGITRIPVVVKDSEGAQRRVLQLTENLQREDLDDVSLARALRELMDLDALSPAQLAHRIHRSHGYVENKLKLIAHEDVARAVQHGEVGSTVATEIARISDGRVRRGLLAQAAAGPIPLADVREQAKRVRAEQIGPLELPIIGSYQSKTPEIDQISAPNSLLEITQSRPSLDEVIELVGGADNACALLDWGAHSRYKCETLARMIRKAYGRNRL